MTLHKRLSLYRPRFFRCRVGHLHYVHSVTGETISTTSREARRFTTRVR